MPPAAVLMAALAIPLVARPQASRPGFEYFGEWSDVAASGTDDPHANGNSLQLWQENGAIVGFLSEYAGRVADPPIGPLQGVRFDAASGQFSFSAKLSLGVTRLRGQQEYVPTRDVCSFTGTLLAREVRGSLEKRDQSGDSAPVTRSVVWKRKPGDLQDSFWQGKTLEQWRDFYAPILRARGPKW
jgi:hypothetical protein